jgi:hypothetical protein
MKLNILFLSLIFRNYSSSHQKQKFNVHPSKKKENIAMDRERKEHPINQEIYSKSNEERTYTLKRGEQRDHEKK